ncbi:MAG TPA: hypothetical protein VFB13_17555 [Reyranella sp.]|jgi:hypothetical protein|nr:hypothetical protein [Reyranella sp.]
MKLTLADRLLGPPHQRKASWAIIAIGSGVLIVLIAVAASFGGKSSAERAQQMLACVRYQELFAQKLKEMAGLPDSSPVYQSTVQQAKGYALMLGLYAREEHVDANSIKDGSTQGIARGEEDFGAMLRKRAVSGKLALTDNVKTYMADCQGVFASAGFTRTDWINCTSPTSGACTLGRQP